MEKMTKEQAEQKLQELQLLFYCGVEEDQAEVAYAIREIREEYGLE